MPKFFDKIGNGINKGVATASANAKAVMEKTKINAVISNLENEHTQLARLLGQRVYDMYKINGEIAVDDGMSNFIAEIEKRLMQIEQQKEQLRRVDDELSMVTGKTQEDSLSGAACDCGSVNAEGAKFCAKCGNSLLEVEG